MGNGRVVRCPYAARGLRRGGLGSLLGSPLENGAALRLFARRACSSCFRDGKRSSGPLPVCRARLASRRLRVTFGFSLGKRCGASLVRAQGLFQLLPQALVLRQCALQLLLRGLDSPFEFLLPIRGANAIGGLHPFHDDTNAEICSELSLKVLYLLSYPLVNILYFSGCAGPGHGSGIRKRENVYQRITQ